MGGSYSVRDAALDTLTACRRNGAWADGELKRVLNDARFDGRDAALCTRLVYGVLQNRALLDFYLSCFYEKPFKQLQPQLQDILELGAYQLLFTDKIPDHAADRGLGIVKRFGCACEASVCHGTDKGQVFQQICIRIGDPLCMMNLHEIYENNSIL